MQARYEEWSKGIKEKYGSTGGCRVLYTMCSTECRGVLDQRPATLENDKRGKLSIEYKWDKHAQCRLWQLDRA